MQESIGLDARAAARADAQEGAAGTIDAEKGSVTRVGGALYGNGLPMKKGAGGGVGEVQLGHADQRRVWRKELWPEEPGVARLPHRLPWHRCLEAVRAYARALKQRKRAPRAERRAEIGGERPHVESLAAADADHEVRQSHRLERDGGEHDVARLPVDVGALAGELVEPLALVMEGRVHRGHLADGADEASQGPLHVGPLDGGDR